MHVFLPNWLIFFFLTRYTVTPCLFLDPFDSLSRTPDFKRTLLRATIIDNSKSAGENWSFFPARDRGSSWIERTYLTLPGWNVKERNQGFGRRRKTWLYTRGVHVRPRKLCSRPQMWGTRGLVSRVSRWRIERDALTRVKWKVINFGDAERKKRCVPRIMKRLSLFLESLFFVFLARNATSKI